MRDMDERLHRLDEKQFWWEQIEALREELRLRRRQEVEGFRFRLAELSILAATATAALVAIRWTETGSGRFLSGSASVAFLLTCFTEIVLVWRAAAGDEKLQVWCPWDTIGPLTFVGGLGLGVLGVAFLV